MPSADRLALRRLRHDERGQTLVFALTTLLALMLVAAAAVNIGQAVTRRMLLQVLADAGAYTGASVMARGMNTIANENRRIQQAWALTADATLGFTLPPCVASDTAIAAYGVAQSALARLIRALNEGYGARAASEAQRVTRYNAVDLFPGERLTMGESDADSGLNPQRPADRLTELEEVPDGTDPAVSSLSPGSKLRAWACFGLLVQPRVQTFDLWFQRKPDAPPTAFLWVVKAPRRQARFFDRFFGPYAVPEMTAAAVAKPVGGEIRRGRAEYVAKLMPLRNVRARVFDAWFRRSRPIHH